MDLERLRRDAAERHIRGTAGALERVIDDDEQFRGGEGAGRVARDARRVLDYAHSIPAEAARHFRVAARAHDQHEVRIAGGFHRRVDTFRDRQDGHEDEHHTGDADHRDSGRAEARRDRSDVHAGNRDNLRQHQFLRNASTIRRRLACHAGRKPEAIPSAATSTTPAISDGVGK